MPAGGNSTRNKYNWPKLKAEYLTSDVPSVADFLRDKGIGPRPRETTGWAGEKKDYQQKVLASATDRGIQTEAESLTDTRVRQARLARFLQLKGAEKLKEVRLSDLSPEDARKMVVTGLEQERRALGMEGGGAQNLTQININPKTNLDKMIEGMDYEQLLGLIAELKHDREGRVVQEAADGSAGEASEGEVL